MSWRVSCLEKGVTSLGPGGGSGTFIEMRQLDFIIHLRRRFLEMQGEFLFFIAAVSLKAALILSMKSQMNLVGWLVVWVGISFMLQACAGEKAVSADDTEAAIVSVLTAQVDAWNRADIPAFMETYVKGEALRFSSGGNVRRGWQATMDRYLTTYPTPEAMGHLDFEDLEVLVLTDQWAQVHGRYRLKREGDYGNATGLFTLLLQHGEDGWKILHDHTSAGE